MHKIKTTKKATMDIKALHKSSTFSSFTGGTHKISNWFAALGEHRRKSSMKASKSLTLGKLLVWIFFYNFSAIPHLDQRISLSEFYYVLL